jgi:hypothetical protein
MVCNAYGVDRLEKTCPQSTKFFLSRSLAGVSQLPFVPEGLSTLAQQFTAGFGDRYDGSPGGTEEMQQPVVPLGLGEGMSFLPSDESLGYLFAQRSWQTQSLLVSDHALFMGK